MKKHAVLILLILHLLYPVCEGIGAVLGLEFALFSDWGFFLSLAAVTVALTCAAEPTRAAAFLFPLTVIGGLCAVWCTQWLPAAFCAAVWCVCGGILFHRSMVKGVKKVLVLIPTVLLILVLGLSCAVDLFAEVMRSVTVVREVDSPGGTYTARVINADYGATGGDTLVKVYDNSQTLNLLFGSFTPEAELEYRGEWGEFNDLNVSWSDGHTLTIEGRTRIICSGPGVIRSIVMQGFDSVTVNGELREDPEWLRAFLAALQNSRATRRLSIQDYPTEDVLYQISFGGNDLFLWEENGAYYIEQPYQGIWKADEGLMDLLM